MSAWGTMMNLRLPVTALAAFFASETWAADYTPEETTQSEIDLVIELGFGAQIQPEYEGSEDYEIFPIPVIGVGYLNVPGLFTLGSLADERGGFSIGPSFNYLSDRDFNDDSDLFGLNEVDATFEVGVRASYEWKYAEVWGEARYAFGGADGLVGEFGINGVAHPTSNLELKFGPFATAAGGNYMDTYFGVSPAESANTGFRVAAFDPDGGFKSFGVRGIAKYEFRPTWYLNMEATYSKLVGDAAESPIVEFGDENQFMFSLGISKKFELDLF